MVQGVVSPRLLAPNLVEDSAPPLSPCGNDNHLRRHWVSRIGTSGTALTGFRGCAAIAVLICLAVMLATAKGCVGKHKLSLCLEDTMGDKTSTNLSDSVYHLTRAPTRGLLRAGSSSGMR